MQTQQVLQTLRLPARLTAEQAGALLGFHPDSITFLAKSKLIKTLGQTEDVQLMFSAVHIQQLCVDEKWLTKATNAVRLHHKQKNAAQQNRRALQPEGGFKSSPSASP
jgi:hypothetical protein